MLSSPEEITKLPPQLHWLHGLRAEKQNESERAEDNEEELLSKRSQRSHIRKLRQMQCQNMVQRSISSICEMVSVKSAA